MSRELIKNNDIRESNPVITTTDFISFCKSGLHFMYYLFTPLFSEPLESYGQIFYFRPRLKNLERDLSYNFYLIKNNLDPFDLLPESYINTIYLQFHPNYFKSVCYMSSTPNTPTTSSVSTPSSTIFNSSFRDKFLNEFHLNMANQKLTCISDNSSKNISKNSYNRLKDACNIVYELSVFSNSTQGFEGFIDGHTYITCTHEIKENKYILNTFFTYDINIFNTLLNTLEFVPDQAKISWITNVTQNGLQIEELPVEVPKPIFNSFYPWLNGYDLKEFLENFLNSNESILVFYGDPGTGKSNLLKYLLHEYNLSALITYQDNIRDLDSMFSHFLKGDDNLLIIEDADEFLTKREAGNTSMKRLLNITDGLTSNKDKKVIFTTNLTNTNSIDSALLREGRCFGAFRFEPLLKEEALLVAKDLEIDQNLLIKDKYTLAELFAIKNNKMKLVKGSAIKPFGFNK